MNKKYILLYFIFFNFNILSFECSNFDNGKLSESDLQEFFNKENKINVRGFSDFENKWYSGKIKYLKNEPVEIKFKIKKYTDRNQKPQINLIKVDFYNTKEKVFKNLPIICFEKGSDTFKINRELSQIELI